MLTQLRGLSTSIPPVRVADDDSGGLPQSAGLNRQPILAHQWQLAAVGFLLLGFGAEPLADVAVVNSAQPP